MLRSQRLANELESKTGIPKGTKITGLSSSSALSTFLEINGSVPTFSLIGNRGVEDMAKVTFGEGIKKEEISRFLSGNRLGIRKEYQKYGQTHIIVSRNQ